MTDETITDLPTASGIDASADWLAIDRTSLNTTQKINRNTLLGIAGSPVGTTDSQTLTNKVITSPTLTVLDNALTIQDNASPTKQAQFQASSITAGQTRTYTLPDGSTTLVGTDLTQTLTNKTLTAPVINNGSITGTTITTDAIVGQSVATNGTVYGLQITGGEVSGADIQNATIPTAAIADSAVTPAKILTGTGSSWAWQNWTPTITNMSGGTINFAKYIQIGKTVHLRFKYTLGGAGVTNVPIITLPVTANSDYISATVPVFTCILFDNTGFFWNGTALMQGTTSVGLYYFNASAQLAAFSPTVPFTWAVNDWLAISMTYEAA